MWISQLELTNFKSYNHQRFTFPPPVDGKNIVLIGGLNGYGKTSLLEALYLTLYGKEAITHLARAGLKSEGGYPSFLEKALNGQAIRTKRETMSVMVEIAITEHESIQFIRRWFFNKQGSYTEEEVNVYEVHESIRNPKDSDHFEELIDEHFIPAHLAPFFLFDGEEVKKLADQSRVEQIKQGMEGLLGVVLLRRLASRLEQFQANKSQGLSTVDEKKHKDLLDELTQLEDRLLFEQSRKVTVESERTKLHERRTDLNNRFINAGGGAGDVASVKQIIEEQKNAEQKRAIVVERLDEVLSDQLPIHLTSQALRRSLLSQLHGEAEKIKWDDKRASKEPEKRKFLNSFGQLESPPIEPPLTVSQFGALQLRIEAAWESLFFPPPEGCAEELVHQYLEGSRRELVIDMLGQLNVGVQDILDLLEQRDSLQRKIKESIARYTRIEGVDRDGTLAQIRSDLDIVTAQLSQKDEEIGGLKRAIGSIQGDIQNKRALYEREHERFVRANPVKSVVAKAQRVCNLINELIPTLYSLKTNQLAAEITTAFKRLAHKQQIAEIKIDDSGKTVVLSSEGDEITFDRSAGENQLFATALIAGLAKVSGMSAPLVVDTPLGRLDGTHRENILDFWIGDANRQVILLSQDKEIDRLMFKKIENHVGKTYLLHHEQVGNGVGKTWAEEDRYFAREEA